LRGSVRGKWGREKKRKRTSHPNSKGKGKKLNALHYPVAVAKRKRQKNKGKKEFGALLLNLVGGEKGRKGTLCHAPYRGKRAVGKEEKRRR